MSGDETNMLILEAEHGMDGRVVNGALECIEEDEEHAEVDDKSLVDVWRERERGRNEELR